MSFFSNVPARTRAQLPAKVVAREPDPSEKEPHYYRELIAQRPALLDEKLKLHARIIDEFNLASLEKLPREDLAREVRSYLGEYMRTERLTLNQRELQAFAEEIVDEMIGFGPIEPLLKDPTINDILINTHKKCFVERFGKLEETTVHFKDEAHLMRIVQKIVADVGRRIDESSPTVDARLPDGSRVNVAIRPIAVDGPLVSIRKFSKKPFSMDRLVEMSTLRPADGRSTADGSEREDIADRLGRHRHRQDDDAERAVELHSPRGAAHHHRGRRRTAASASPCPADGDQAAERRGQRRDPPARARQEFALRMRPDRIIVGECRGEEAFDMLQAMNTGHEGSMTTVHANSPRDALKRLEQMVSMAGLSISPTSIRSQIASAIRLLIQLQRLPDGRRRVVSIGEITGMEGEVIQMHEIYRFVKEHIDDQGNVHGTFKATGIRPTFLADLKHMGLDLPTTHFDPNRAL